MDQLTGKCNQENQHTDYDHHYQNYYKTTIIYNDTAVKQNITLTVTDLGN